MHPSKFFAIRNSKLAALAIVMILVLVTVIPVAAVTYGEPDGDAHPQVGLLVFDVDGTPAWRCSGTLLSPTVMLTAGHCTFGTSGGRVWFETDVTSGRPDNGYPFGGGTSIEFDAIHTHPEYVDAAFYLHDLGIVILSEPVYLAEYGTLPEIGVLDELATKRGLQDRLFTPVGYGIQSIKPEFESTLVRYNATMQLIDVNGTAGIPAGGSVTYTSNPGKPHRGGTCFGDSGGPTFFQESLVVASVNSFGLNANCKGISGGYRIDTPDDQAFINNFLD